MDADDVKKDEGVVIATMTDETATERGLSTVFPHHPEGAFVSLGWGGRLESPAELAPRYEAMFALIRRLAGDSFRLYEGHLNPEAEVREVPMNGAPLIEWIASYGREPGAERVPWSTTSTSLRADPEATGHRTASISVAAGAPTRTANNVLLRLASDFPIGTAQESVELLLALVRIWQPDVAVLLTSEAVASMSPSTHAAYASWTSTLARGEEPTGRGERAVPYGDGTVWIAEEWSVEALTALNSELVAAGAPRLSKGRALQLPPTLPHDVPEHLVDICRNIRIPNPRGR